MTSSSSSPRWGRSRPVLSARFRRPDGQRPPRLHPDAVGDAVLLAAGYLELAGDRVGPGLAEGALHREIDRVLLGGARLDLVETTDPPTRAVQPVGLRVGQEGAPGVARLDL